MTETPIPACALCGREGPVRPVAWYEPRSPEDSSPVVRRARVCEDCEIVHWAMPDVEPDVCPDCGTDEHPGCCGEFS